MKCLVFTDDEVVIEKAAARGHLTGGEELVEQIQKGDVNLTHYQRALATEDWTKPVQKLARLLGPRGLMPNAKTKTLFPTADSLLETLLEQSSTIESNNNEEEYTILWAIP